MFRKRQFVILLILFVSMIPQTIAARSGEEATLPPADKAIYLAIKDYRSSTKNEQLKIIKDNAPQADLNRHIGFYGTTFLNLAVNKGHYDTVKLLLEQGADPNRRNKRGNQSPLRKAVHKAKPRLVALLLAHGADMAVLTQRDLHQIYDASLKTGEWSLVETLIDDKGVDVNRKNKSKKTALHYAAASGNLKAVESLIARKANVNLKSRANRTAIDLVIRAKSMKNVRRQKRMKQPAREHEKIVETLIANGAKVTKKQAIQYAKVRYTKLGLIYLLISTKISIWILLVIIGIFASALYYFFEGEFEELGIISGAVLGVFLVIVLIIEGICLINPMNHISVAHHPIGWLPYFLLRVSAIVALIPIIPLINEQVSEGGSSGSTSSVSKNCSGCGSSLPLYISKGDRCPHCGGYFGDERWK